MTHHFDELSKSLAEKSIPRRQSLRLLGAAVAGALLSPLGLGTSWAGGLDPCKSFCNQYPKKHRSSCLAACQACSGHTNRVCGSSGSFVCCDTGSACCNGHCTDVANDFDNCGACGASCGDPGPYEDGACIDWQCFYWCAEGAVDCGGGCTSLDSDPDNCGACGNVCGEATPNCYQGACIAGDVGCGPYTDFNWDSSNCGYCGNVCPWGTACVWGVCEGGGGD